MRTFFKTPHEALFVVSGQTSDRCHSAMFVNPSTPPLLTHPHSSSHVHIWENKYGAFCILQVTPTVYYFMLRNDFLLFSVVQSFVLAPFSNVLREAFLLLWTIAKQKNIASCARLAIVLDQFYF